MVHGHKIVSPECLEDGRLGRLLSSCFTDSFFRRELRLVRQLQLTAPVIREGNTLTYSITDITETVILVLSPHFMFSPRGSGHLTSSIARSYIAYERESHMLEIKMTVRPTFPRSSQPNTYVLKCVYCGFPALFSRCARWQAHFARILLSGEDRPF